MKKLVNKADPDNVIIVKDAYVNGDRIVCDAGTDDFDLWRKAWAIEDVKPSISITRYAYTMKQKFGEIPPEFWEGLGVDDFDNVDVIITTTTK